MSPHPSRVHSCAPLSLDASANVKLRRCYKGVVSPVVFVNASATHAVRIARLAVAEPVWRRWLPELPFLAARSSRNGPVRVGRRFAVDPLPALLAEGDDATQFRWQRGARRFPSEQTRPNLRKPVHPGPSGTLLEAADHSPSWPRQIKPVRLHPGPSVPPGLCQNRQVARLHIGQEPCGRAAPCSRMQRRDLAD